MLDSNNLVVSVNQAFEQLYGYSLAELRGKELPIVLDGDRQFEQEIHSFVEKGNTITFETTCVHRDGSLVEVEVTLAAIYDSTGKVIGSAGIARNITERKLAEEKLRQSEEKYRLIADNTMELILVIDKMGVVQYASPSHTMQLGVDASEIEGHDLSEISFIHTHDIEKIKELCWEMITNQLSPGRILTRFQQASGDWLLYEVQAVPVITNHAEVRSVVLTARDVTERERTQEALRKSEKLAVAGQLAAGIAHEIRNPLTPIKGFIQLMQTGKNIEEYLEVITSEINRMENIISEFLLLARPQTIDVKMSNLYTLLENTIQLVNTQAIYRNIQVTHCCATKELFLYCDENQLKQVFINIMRNAIESISKAEGLITIETKRIDDQKVKISIKDNGCGIPENRLNRLGEPFYSTKEKGTGLGLMISNKIIRDHHGEFTITSKENEGTAVHIILPVIDFKSDIDDQSVMDA